MWLKAPNLQTGASRFTLSTEVLHSVGLFLGGLEFISSASPFVVDCFWTNFIEFSLI